MATPRLDHLSKKDWERVYEPAEDSFLLLDALESELSLLRNTLVGLEIGSGSGTIATFVARELLCHMITTDINPDACEITLRTGKHNNVEIDPLLADLASVLRPGLVDLLIFNPPYVVTPPEEVGTNDIAASWAGGIRGRQVIDRLLPLVKTILSPDGIFYMVLINENDPDEIKSILKADGFHSKTIMYRKAGYEGLSIVRFSRSLAS
ncbi:S-adenosyl-L-methionine-dependent methyltransferase [Gorgonomyces haynaldii]|nr:S-adenosyl-L-methionine-dependent methyltransferase [Gorgonomyces haynaldii]